MNDDEIETVNVIWSVIWTAAEYAMNVKAMLTANEICGCLSIVLYFVVIVVFVIEKCCCFDSDSYCCYDFSYS